MTFQIEELTQVKVRNANPRTELHGEDRVRAIDISFSLTGENSLLDLIKQGLREHHYWNKALVAGQEALPEVIVPLPNLRHLELPKTYKYTLGTTGKVRGYRFIWDWGTEAEHVDFTDAAVSNLSYDISEGGSVTLYWTVSYNGEELSNNELYGELCGLGEDGEIHVKLLAPAELQPAKKGYRAGKPDTPSGTDKDPAQGELGGNGGGDDTTAGDDGDGGADGLDPTSPEGALASTERQE